MTTLLISESHVDATAECRCGDTEPYEPYTDNIGRLFRDMQKEYGRCVSSVYTDMTSGEVKRIGWVFQKRQPYDRSEETYIHEVWVTLFDAIEPAPVQPEPVPTLRHHALN